MIIKKKILILLNSEDIFAIQGLKILFKSNFFEIKAIIDCKKTNKKNLKLIKKIKHFYNRFPHSDKKILNFIKLNNIEICISLGFQYRVRASFIKLFSKGVFNIHPAILPNNKGSHSTFYTIMNNYHLGSTLHLMNEKFDSGPIVDQIKQKLKIDHDADFVFKRSRQIGLKLLKKNLKKIYFNKFKKKYNKNTKINFKKNIVKASTLKFDRKYTGEYLWRLIRAVNYKNNGFYIKFKKKRFKVTPHIGS